jgi:putative membrane protein
MSAVDPRVQLGAERTLLAWLRTGIAVMGFGFVVARFGLYLRELAATRAEVPLQRPHTAGVGVLLVMVGIVINAWASVRHLRLTARLRGGSAEILPHGPVAVGAASAVIGLVLVVMLLSALL